MNMKKLIALILAVVMVLTLAACTKRQPDEKENDQTDVENSGVVDTTGENDGATESTEITVTDMIGREVTLDTAKIEKVVCIGAGALRMYCYVGDTALLSGVEDIDNTSLADRPKMFDSSARPYMLAYGDVFAELPSCGVGGPNAQTAEAEKILACSPDIVISEYEDVEKEDALAEQLGVPVITLKTGFEGVFSDDFKGSIKLLGEIFGKEEKADALVAFVDAETAAITARTADIAEDVKPSVYICGLGNWGTTNHLMTSETYKPFAVANIRNAVSGLGIKGMGAIEEEKFVSLGADMDKIIIDAAAVKNIKPLYAEDPTMFDTCKAWTDGEVYLEMPYNSYYTNYEIALANAWFIAKTAYPEQFEDVDMTAKLDEITEAFLGEKLADEIFSCGTSFGGYQKIDTASFFD